MAEADIAIFRTELIIRRRQLERARAAPSAQLVRLLQEVDAALERIDVGTFGLCETCHDPIEHDRLLADPLLRYCIDHLTTHQQAALQHDLDLAARIQHSLLPPRNLKTEDWEVAYHYEPAGPVSGDYCDLIPSADGGFLFLAADVSGKGVAASLLMSHLHATFRTLVSLGMPLAELLGRANRLFCESTLPTHYATLICGRTLPGGEVELSNAGHCPPLWIRASGVETIEAGGLPIGLFCSSEYPIARIRLEKGDRLLLYTDGLSEAQNAQQDDYGLDRLTDFLRRQHAADPATLLRGCLADVAAFLAGGEKRDDLSAVVIARR